MKYHLYSIIMFYMEWVFGCRFFVFYNYFLKIMFYPTYVQSTRFSPSKVFLFGNVSKDDRKVS